MTASAIAAFGAEAEDIVEARRNWPAIAMGVATVLFLVAGAVVGSRYLVQRAERHDAGIGGPRGEDADTVSVLDHEPPSLEDLTSEVTLPPGPSVGLTVAETGVTIVEDRFDPSEKEGTYAVILTNPHDDWLAQGVEIGITFLDTDGSPVGSDTGFVPVVLPGQTVAIASLIFNAPSAEVHTLGVSIDVALWHQTGPVDGTLTATVTDTAEDDLAGVRTTFRLTSTFDTALSDVAVTAVHRDATGAIIGGFDTFLDRVEPGIPVEDTITLLINVDPDDIARTDLFPTVGFGFDTGG